MRFSSKKEAEMEPKGDQGHAMATWFWHPRAPQDAKHVQRPYKTQKTSKKTIPRPQHIMNMTPKSIFFGKKRSNLGPNPNQNSILIPTLILT